MKNDHHELFLRVILLLVTVLFGAGLFAASNYSVHYRAAAAAVPLAERDYTVSLPSPPHILRDPLSLMRHCILLTDGGAVCAQACRIPCSITRNVFDVPFFSLRAPTAVGARQSRRWGKPPLDFFSRTCYAHFQ